MAEWLREAECGDSDSTNSHEPTQDAPPRKCCATVFMGPRSHRLGLTAPRSGSSNDDRWSTDYRQNQAHRGIRRGFIRCAVKVIT